MTTTPSPYTKKGSNRFKKGNPGGGNTSAGAKRAWDIDRAFKSVVTAEDFKAVAAEVKAIAMMEAHEPAQWNAKLKAATYIIDRFMGKTRQQVDVEVTETSRVDMRVLVTDLRETFGLTQIATGKTKQVKAVEVEGGPAPAAALPDPAGRDIAVGPVLPLPEAVDHGPVPAEDRGEGASGGVHLDRSLLVGDAPAGSED